MKKLVTKLLVVAMLFTILPANLVMAEENQEKQKQQVSSKVEEKVKKKEATDKRTERSKTFYNNNGTATTELHQSPIHYHDPISKKWKDIDNTLVKKSASDTYTNVGNVFQVGFTDTLTKEKTVMEMTEKDYSISLKPISSNGKEPKTTEAKVKENKVTYVEAYENTDLVYSVGNEKVKEDIILKEKPATDESISYTFAMDLKGLTHEVKEDGRILLKDKKSGDTIYYLEKPFMFDSLQPEGFTGFSESAVPEEALSYEVEMKTEKKGNQLLISIIPSKDWLLDDSRTYPITIDPTIVKYQPVTELVDTNIRSALPTQTGGSDLELGAGLYKNSTTNNVIRSLLNFDISDIPAGVRVIDAQLNLWASSVWNDTSVRLDLHPVTSAWDENAATWNKRTASAAWLRSGGDYGSSSYSSQTVGALGSTLASNHYKWSVAPSHLEKTINSGNVDLGFLLKSAAETTAAYKKFYSGDNLDYAGYSPLLSVTYVTNSRLGLEDHWTYNEQEIADGKLYVNLGTGNGLLQTTDFVVDSRGNSGISFERTYNTKAAETDSFGPGWSFTGSESLTEQTADKNITYTDRDGTVHLFLYNSVTHNYTTPAGVYLTLTKDGTDGYKLIDKFGNISRFKKILQDDETSGYTIAKLEYEQDRNGNKTSYTYNTKGNVTRITDASGKFMSISYGSSGISSIVFADKRYTYHYTYDGQLKEVRKYKDLVSYISTFYTYDANGKLEKIVDANNTATQIFYKNGFVQSIQQPSASDVSLPVTSYSYDISNYVSEVTDPEGGVTKYQMNENYVVLSIIDPLGAKFSKDSMDINYNATQTTSPENIISKGRFDANGNLLEEISAKGTKTYSYDSYSNMLTATDSNGTTSFSYDKKGNLISLTEPNGNVTKYSYNLYGNKTSTTFPDNSTEFYTYDELNNFQNTMVDALGRTTISVTNEFGNITSEKDAKGYSTLYMYDQRQLLTEVTDANKGITTYNYDANGNMTSVTDTAGKTKTFTYNEQNKVSSEKLPMGQITSMTYDDNGNLVSVIKPSSSVIKNQYDFGNQLTGVYVDETKKWSFTYDDMGNTETVTNETTGELTNFVHNENGNVLLETKGNISVAYDYNDVNELTSLTGKSNEVVRSQSFTLNKAGNMEELYLNGNKHVTISYNKMSFPTLVSFNNGINSVYDYDHAQQMTNLSVTKSEELLLNESFTYDNNGNILSILSNLGDRSYTYDSMDQLISQTLPDGTTESYEYDAVGNRTKKITLSSGQSKEEIYTHNDNNQISMIDGYIYSYDKNGNRIKDHQFIYEYDEFNQLINIKNLSGQIISSYTYDEKGRRISKTTNNEIRYYHYGNGINILFETDENGKIVAEYSYDQSGFPLTMSKDGEIFYYVLNGHKDVVALTNSVGETVATYSYDAWGNILSQEGVMADVNPYRYAGYRYDSETKLYYLIARYYNAAEGVFLSLDPNPGELSQPESQNGYNYVNNNPISYTDPNGEAAAFSWARIRYAGKYALKAWMAGYIGWNAAESVISGSVAIIDKISQLAKTGLKAGKSKYRAMTDAFRNVMSNRSNRRALENAIRRISWKVGAKAAGRLVTRVGFWWTDALIIGGNFGYGYYIYGRK